MANPGEEGGASTVWAATAVAVAFWMAALSKDGGGAGVWTGPGTDSPGTAPRTFLAAMGEMVPSFSAAFLCMSARAWGVKGAETSLGALGGGGEKVPVAGMLVLAIDLRP